MERRAKKFRTLSMTAHDEDMRALFGGWADEVESDIRLLRLDRNQSVVAFHKKARPVEANSACYAAEPMALTEDHIISMLLGRRARKAFLGENLFSDPAWDILLEVFGAQLGNREMTTSELALAIEAPISTTLRWITELEQRGLIDKAAKGRENPTICLSAEGAVRMERLAGRWASAFLAI